MFLLFCKDRNTCKYFKNFQEFSRIFKVLNVKVFVNPCKTFKNLLEKLEDSQTLCDSNLILFDIGNNLLISSFSAACLSSICSLSLIAAARLSLLLSSFCFFSSPAERISSAKVCILASAFSFPRSSHSHTINISDRKSVKAIYYGPDIEKRYKSHLRKVAQLRGLEEYDVSVDLDNPNFELKLTKL